LNPSQEHLALKLVRLKVGEEFLPNPEGLTFVFAKGGAGKCATRAVVHSLAAGDILVLNGAAGGKLSVQDKKTEFLFWVFSMCFENLLPLFSGNEVSLLHNITDSYQSAKIYPTNHPVSQECHRHLALVPPQFNLDHRGQLIRIAAAILSIEFKDAQTRRSSMGRAEDHMVQVFERLSSNEIINLSVGELAEKFSCSRRHLNRLFHQHFGVSVAALRMEMRLLKAMSLLRDPDAKVINVAEQCGFNHLGLFNTCFKRRFGTSPGQWRKTTQQAESAVKTKSKPDSKPACPLHANGLCPWGGPLDTHLPTSEPGRPSAVKSGAGGRVETAPRRMSLLDMAASPPVAKRGVSETRAGE
jgi:AraC-like DNA-binding protein